jgi:predicted RNA binding protein YcfA (HicA-like mRNA interferase family)
MTRLPHTTGKDLVRALQKLGFSVDRTRCSQVFLKHSDGRPQPCRYILEKHSVQAYCVPSFAIPS